MPEPLRRAALSVFFLLAVVVALIAIATSAASAAPTEPPQDVDLQWGVRIPMRDGVELAAPATAMSSFSSTLRLVVSCPNSSSDEKNYNSGGVVADETAKDARTAHVVLYHDAEHPSVLEIPVVK